MGAAISVLSSLDRIGTYVIPATDHSKPRHDLKRPWDHIRSAAELEDVRIHDLRHTYASIGASAGFGLPVVGRLLGHASPMTTQRYAHLADDPLRRASEAIGDSLMRALEANVSRLRELLDKVEVTLDSSLPLAGAEAG
jgi:integrase